MQPRSIVHRLKELITGPFLAPDPANPANDPYLHLRSRVDEWREEVQNDVKTRDCYAAMRDRQGPFKDELQALKNDLRALDSLENENRVELIEEYLNLFLPTPKNFVDRVLAASRREDGNVLPWSKMNVSQRDAHAERLRDWMVAQRPKRQQQPHAASAPSAGYSAPAPQEIRPSPETQHFLYGRDPLVLTCRDVIAACRAAKIPVEDQRRWYELFQHTVHAARPLQLGEEGEVVRILSTGATLVCQSQDSAAAGKALTNCLREVQRKLHRAPPSLAGEMLHSLGSSNRPFHRLSHRQRAIYGRTFSSSAY